MPDIDVLIGKLADNISSIESKSNYSGSPDPNMEITINDVLKILRILSEIQVEIDALCIVKEIHNKKESKRLDALAEKQKELLRIQREKIIERIGEQGSDVLKDFVNETKKQKNKA